MTEDKPSSAHAAARPAASRRAVPGSSRQPLPGSQRVAQVAADQELQITVVLRRRAPLPEHLGSVLTRTELAERYGADPADVSAVVAAVQEAGARVTGVDASSRRVSVSGSAGVLEELFGTRLEVVRAPQPRTDAEVEFRQRQGALSVPAQLAEVVTAVLGLDDRPQARSRARIAHSRAVSVSYTPVDLGRVYRFPDGTDGAGQRIAIIELGGGFTQADLDNYFTGLGIVGPQVTAVGVDGADNAPENDPSGADGEVLLDIEVVGALAPASEVLVYFAPNTDAGFLDAVATASHAEPAPAAISISWGQNEDEWTEQARTAMDEAFADAAALGVTVTAAAGDDGSTDRATDGQAHCDFPASSPHALACGGTSLRADAATGTVSSETVWNNGTGRGATGGGVSSAFPLPDWQSAAGVPAARGGRPGRGVPDVSGDADPQTGYQVLVDGSAQVIGGTSAVAPLWAALTARLVQALDRPLGLLQPVLYAGVAAGVVQPGFRDITAGSNGEFTAGAGWDACTGLGVPDGTALLAALRDGVAG